MSTTTAWKPKNLKNFPKKFEIQILTKTWTYMMTSGMQRRPFEGRHLVYPSYPLSVKQTTPYYCCLRSSDFFLQTNPTLFAVRGG